MIRKLLLALILLAHTVSTAFGQCEDFPKLMEEGAKHKEAAKYEEALSSFTAAMVVCPDSAATAINAIKVVFKKIEELKEQAEKDRERAITAKTRAEDSEKLAKIQRAASKSLLMTSKAKDWRKEERDTEAFALLQAAYDTAEQNDARPSSPLQAALAEIYYDQESVWKEAAFNMHTNSVTSVAASPDGQVLLTGSRDNTAILWNRQGEALQVLKGHTDFVEAVAFSPDGQQVLTGGADGLAILWDLKGHLLQQFSRHTEKLSSVAFSPDGKKVLTGSWDSTAILWSLEGKVLQTFEGHTDYVNSVAFSPNNTRIITAGKDKKAILWNLQGDSLIALEGHYRSINSVAFSPDGKNICTGSLDNTAIIWDLKGQKLSELKGHKDWVSAVAFSPTGEHLLTGSRDGINILWDTKGNSLKKFKGHRSGVSSLAFCPDGVSAITGSWDNTAILWDLKPKKPQPLLPPLGVINTVVFSPDGKTFLTGGSGFQIRFGILPGQVSLWNLDGELLSVFPVYSQYANAVSFSPSGKFVLVGEGDEYREGVARLFDLKGNERLILKGHNKEVKAVAFSPNGENILTGSLDSTAILWNMEGDSLLTLSGHKGAVNAVSFSPEGKRILTGSSDGTAILWDLEGDSLLTLSGHKGAVNAVSLYPEGKRILTGSSDGTAILWSLEGDSLLTLSGHRKAVNAVAFSPGGKRILTGSSDSTAILWDLGGNKLSEIKQQSRVSAVAFSPLDGKTILTGNTDQGASLWDLQGQRILKLQGHRDPINAIAFAPNGKKVLTGSYKTAILSSLKGKVLQVLEGHAGEINTAAFSPNGKTIATGGEGNDELGEVILWDLEGNRLQTFEGHAREVNTVAFAPNGKSLLTGGGSKYREKPDEAILWDLEGNKLQDFKGHTKKINTLAFSPDGKNILTGSDDGTAILWDIEGDSLFILEGHTAGVTSVSFSPKGKYILTADKKGILRRWDMKGKLLNRYSGDLISSNNTNAMFSPDEEAEAILTEGGYKVGDAVMLDLEGKLIQAFPYTQQPLSALAISPDGKRVIMGYRNGNAQMVYTIDEIADINKGVWLEAADKEELEMPIDTDPKKANMKPWALWEHAQYWERKGELAQAQSFYQQYAQQYNSPQAHIALNRLDSSYNHDFASSQDPNALLYYAEHLKDPAQQKDCYQKALSIEERPLARIGLHRLLGQQVQDVDPAGFLSSNNVNHLLSYVAYLMQSQKSWYSSRTKHRNYKLLDSLYQKVSMLDKAAVTNNTKIKVAQVHSEFAYGALWGPEYQLALSAAKKSVELTPSNAPLKINLSVAYVCVGEIQKAVEVYNRIKDITYDCTPPVMGSPRQIEKRTCTYGQDIRLLLERIGLRYEQEEYHSQFLKLIEGKE